MACSPHQTHLGLTNSKRTNGLIRLRVNFSLWKRRCQPACKPGSVWPKDVSLNVAAIPLGRSSLTASSNQPGRRAWKRGLARTPVVPIRFCSRWGLPCRPHYCVRGALLPHPFTLTPEPGRSAFCGTVPGVTPAGRYPAPCLHGARTFLPEREARSGRPAD